MTDNTKSVNVRIKTLGDKSACESFFVATGRKAKLFVGEVCKMSEKDYAPLEDSAYVEKTKAKADCELINGEIIRS